VPPQNDYGTRYFGGIVDNTNVHAERNENNNVTVYTDGVPYNGGSFVPTPVQLNPQEDA
jgi:hypothetical protein